MVLVRFFTLPTCTVTYGSDVPLLSLAINPWALITEETGEEYDQADRSTGPAAWNARESSLRGRVNFHATVLRGIYIYIIMRSADGQ